MIWTDVFQITVLLIGLATVVIMVRLTQYTILPFNFALLELLHSSTYFSALLRTTWINANESKAFLLDTKSLLLAKPHIFIIKITKMH